LLGAGGFGKVYYVKHKIRGDIYALKVIPRVEGNIDREALVLREQQTIVALAGLSGVVELDASSFDSMNFFMLMVSRVLDLVNCTGRLGLAHNVAKFYFIQLLGALSSIHMKGIIHRDVKLDNCLIDRNGYLVLADFGEQRVCLRQEYIPFMATRLCGTAEYMAPELCAGLPYAFQVDVWAASICLFEMLFGKTPWFQRHRGADVRARIMSEPLVLPNRNIGKLARDFLERSLAKNPCERLSMDEM
ncbi:kinase-like protein, partial [Fistulina hepatica ATCC 64428]